MKILLASLSLLTLSQSAFAHMSSSNMQTHASEHSLLALLLLPVMYVALKLIRR